MSVIRGMTKGLGGAVALAALLLAPLASADARTKRKPQSNLTDKQSSLAAKSSTFGAFTPAAADPRMAAAFARSGLGTGLGATPFRFTPSMNNGPRAVTIAVRARMVSRPEAAKALGLPSDGLAASSYSLGASIGWKRFAFSGDVAKIGDTILPDGRESADVGVSFFGKRWETKLEVAGERSLNDRPVIGIDQSWSVGLGGSYSLTRNLNVTGGVRYKTQIEDPLQATDSRRDSQAVYLGTTFKF
jgi:opacity protein-like surface antigen